jgi:glucose-1-phosphate cytidylyltransferase
MRINGGFFAFSAEIFDYVKVGEELVEAPFARLIAQKRLVSYPWDGFWRCMDTFKDKITFDRMEASGDSPWKVWQPGGGNPGSG